ncbi:MAG: double-strand break repair helicase AddA [Alphaproteobacteria bacterium]
MSNVNQPHIPAQTLPAKDAGADQSAAANPLRSVWVGASAGTGKTKVLIDRVLRLMLPRAGQGAENRAVAQSAESKLVAQSATRPERVLCLTFTKTAAAEMSNRIYKRLARWAVVDDAKLTADLTGLLGAAPNAETLREARRLFARVLDTPGGLKIMTIHSFCQSVLKRFPVEAGLPPHFELMDEQSAIEYLLSCQRGMIAAARAQPDSPVAEAFATLALYLNQEDMSGLMAQVMAKRSLLEAILKKHGDAGGGATGTIAAVCKHLGVTPETREEDVLAGAGRIEQEQETKLRLVLRAMLEGGKTDKERAGALQTWLEQPGKRGALIGVYRRAFFNQQGEIYARLVTKPVLEACPDAIEIMTAEAERLDALNEKLKAVRLARLNAALLTVSAEMVGRYSAHKAATDRLDFDDLIIRTSALLDAPGMVGWVLFKLDEGIDHILVDEAQDTSPAQWRVVRALAGEFFAGMGSRDDTVRTLFVVGDEKQSIFSFQGADPAAFAQMQEFFGRKVTAVQDGWEIFLEYSFRSTRTVLEVVDGVFAPLTARRGVVADIAREVLHRPFREGHAGRVELWPLVQAQTRDAGEAWRMPVDIETGDNAASRLARKIAETVRDWLAHGEILESKGRPIRAGDVMILVQSRGALVDMMMRALKEAEVPVAGIDRITLTEEIGVMDLLAVAGFALQPRDDLTLATVLKSPLVGMTEEDLFALCYGRPHGLWQSLRDARPDIALWLQKRIERSGYATPYEFFAEIMNTACPADTLSGRRAFYARLGLDIQDALDEFLNSCLHFEQSHTPALQGFCDWFLRGEAQIKREQEAHKADQVRIMTVHASKGLQAPIVFLPDTVKILHDHNKGRVRLLWPEENVDGRASSLDVPLWSPRQEFDAGIYDRAREAAAEKQMEEYRRLLYVALTRAEDRLYIAGFRGKHAPKDGCWYNLVAASFPAAAENIAFNMEGAPLADAEGNILSARRLAHPQTVPAEKAPLPAAAQDADAVRRPLPDWARAVPEAEPVPPVPLAPSKPGEDEPAAKSPLGTDDSWRFRRGVIVHQLLEILPQLPSTRREDALLRWLGRPSLGMTAAEQKVFAAEVMAVLAHPDFADIFAPTSRAEVPVVGLAGAAGTAVPQKVLSGQIDRLCVSATEVLVVDFKTNRPPPKDESGVPAVYLKQMAAYRDILRKIYPDKAVRTALLWTDGPVLMPLSDKLLDPHAP